MQPSYKDQEGYLPELIHPELGPNADTTEHFESKDSAEEVTGRVGEHFSEEPHVATVAKGSPQELADHPQELPTPPPTITAPSPEE